LAGKPFQRRRRRRSSKTGKPSLGTRTPFRRLTLSSAIWVAAPPSSPAAFHRRHRLTPCAASARACTSIGAPPLDATLQQQLLTSAERPEPGRSARTANEQAHILNNRN
jgi:hypothetical protein